MGFLHNLRYRLRMLTSSEIAVGAKMLPGWVGMVPEIGWAGRRSIRTGWTLSRYWDAVVPLADSSRLAAANEMSPSPSISGGSVISGQMAHHVHVCRVEMTATCRRGVQHGTHFQFDV